MKSRSLELAAQWMEKTRHDLVTARAVLDLLDGPNDTPCFHAQQAVEKALKALLTACDVRFQRVHDLMSHCDAAIPYAPGLKAYRQRIADLADYAIQVRYPGDWEEPSRTDALAALTTAEQVVSFITDELKPKSGARARKDE